LVKSLSTLGVSIVRLKVWRCSNVPKLGSIEGYFLLERSSIDYPSIELTLCWTVQTVLRRYSCTNCGSCEYSRGAKMILVRTPAALQSPVSARVSWHEKILCIFRIVLARIKNMFLFVLKLFSDECESPLEDHTMTDGEFGQKVTFSRHRVQTIIIFENNCFPVSESIKAGVNSVLLLYKWSLSYLTSLNLVVIQWQEERHIYIDIIILTRNKY